MEVIGGLASTLQIVSQCGQVTMTIIKWAESVKTVDQRINGFVYEVNALKATYQSLNGSLKDPTMLEAAKTANRDVGGHLWTQLSRTLQDCDQTLSNITNVLRRIQTSSNLLRPVIKQLRESLNSGELVRLREQITMFNSSLQLPMQMITLTLQLKQHEMTTSHQLQINNQLQLLQKDINRVELISRRLMTAKRQTSISGSTIVDEHHNMGLVETAKKFLDTASVAASTLSAPSTYPRDGEEIPAGGFRRHSAFEPLDDQKLQTIGAFVQTTGPAHGLQALLAPDREPAPELQAERCGGLDTVDLHLLKAMLRNGQNAFEEGDFTKAEDNFREALSESQNQESHLALSTADIILMLCQCLTKLEKYDEAISLLVPLASQVSSKAESPLDSCPQSNISCPADQGQALSASHQLGEVYLRKGDCLHAEGPAVQAFKGRRELLGENHAKTLESVALIIDMYKAKGQNARAEAYRDFLKPLRPVQEVLTPISSPTTSFEFEEPLVDPRSIEAGKQRRSAFGLGSPFKRHERSHPVHTGQLPLLPRSVEDNYLSSSPHDTSSLNIEDPQQVKRGTRVNSSTSNGSHSTLQRFDTASDSTDPDPLVKLGKSSSSSKAPALYASMSRPEMEQKFNEIIEYHNSGKSSKAAERGISFLQRYDQQVSILLQRTDELKENIKKNRGKGLAGTGFGFAPVHFFCSLKFEAIVEIEILLRAGADVNAVAYKAGWAPRKDQPFTPLSLAVERGHQNVVRSLLQAGATWDLPISRTHPLVQASSNGHVGIVEPLLQHGFAIPEDAFSRLSWHGNSLLHEACFRCDLGLVGFLMHYARDHGILSDTSYSFVGRPGQQDSFGLTPIMYSIDMRDGKDQDLIAHKLRTRIACLKLLLEDAENVGVRETDNDEVVVEHSTFGSPDRLASDLHVQDKKGNNVYWYADDSRGGDAPLREYLDEQVHRSRLIDI